MYLFNLDLWEARFLVAINGILNFVIMMFILFAVVSMILHGKGMRDNDDDFARPVKTAPKGGPLDTIKQMGGENISANRVNRPRPLAATGDENGLRGR